MIRERKVRPKIGLLPTGHKIYWKQFPGLKDMGTNMYRKLVSELTKMGEVVAVELVDTHEKAIEAARVFSASDIDILLIFPFGYTTGMMIVPTVKNVSVPVCIINAHEDSSYDYKNADTAVYLHHEGPCCIPEYAYTLVNLNIKFKIVSGHFGDKRMWQELRCECDGAAAARMFKMLNFGIIGNTYTNMTDMPVDEQRIMKATGRLLCRPEVEEIEEAFGRVTDDQIEGMYTQFREMYCVDESVTNDHMKISAKIAVAFDEVITRYDISGFGYYWWGEKEIITELRSQSALAVSRLAALGRPGVTEGDVKTAMAIKLLDLLGSGGMFLEFFSMDFDENFIMVGHDGPSNISVASGKPQIKHLDVHHGKTGHGLGIDYTVEHGTVTLVNITQAGVKDTFKVIYSVGEVIPGNILNIGNPNCRVRVQKPIPQFFNDWCQQGPSHHFALGIGELSQEIKAFSHVMGFECVRI